MHVQAVRLTRARVPSELRAGDIRGALEPTDVQLLANREVPPNDR